MLNEAKDERVAESDAEDDKIQNMLDFICNVEEFGLYSLGQRFPTWLRVGITGEL